MRQSDAHLGLAKGNTPSSYYYMKFFSLFAYIYITLHYITLHYITLHYITLHYITLHYITCREAFIVVQLEMITRNMCDSHTRWACCS